MLECKNDPLMLFSFCIVQIKLRYLHISSYKLLLFLEILSHAVNFIYFKPELQAFARTLTEDALTPASTLLFSMDVI